MANRRYQAGDATSHHVQHIPAIGPMQINDNGDYGERRQPDNAIQLHGIRTKEASAQQWDRRSGIKVSAT